MKTKQGQIGAGRTFGPFTSERAPKANLGKIKLTLGIAAVIWPLFAFVDAYIVHFVYPGRLWLYWLFRSVGCFFVFSGVAFVYGIGHKFPKISGVIELLLGLLLSVLVAVMSIEYKGIASPLVLGVCLLITMRGITFPRSWKHNLLPLAGMALLYPSTFLVLAFFNQSIGSQFGQLEALASFGLHSLFLFSITAISLWSGHMIWSERTKNQRSDEGRYVLKRVIGKGGMGEVWLGANQDLGKDVAIKILKPDENSDPMILQRFEQEVHATSRLNHPHIVRIFDHGMTHDRFFYYVMEYVPGIDLHDVVAHEGPLDPLRALKIIAQAARALAEAHRHGIIHRDLKPANIVLRRMANHQDFIKVLDFGFAKLIDEKNAGLTQVGWAVGTPQYISPEMIRGQAVDGRSDIYGLGAVLYFLLTGQPPFNLGGTKANIFAHLEQKAESPSVLLGKTLPNGVESIVFRCLAKRPERRFQSAGDMAKALEYLAKEIEVQRRSQARGVLPPSQRRDGPKVLRRATTAI